MFVPERTGILTANASSDVNECELAQSTSMNASVKSEPHATTVSPGRDASTRAGGS